MASKFIISSLFIILIYLSFIALSQQQQVYDQPIPDQSELYNQQHQPDRQSQHIQQFARTMADFMPSQTFTFQIARGQQQNFQLWPNPDIEKIRGVFYLQSQDQEDPQNINGQGFFVGCQVNGVIQKAFVNQRLGVFNLDLSRKPANVKLIFKTDIQPLSIYVSYELKKQAQKKVQITGDQNVPTQQQQQLIEKKSKLVQVSQKFQKVYKTIQSQQNSLRMILKSIGKHGKRLEGNLKYAHYRIAIQTVIVLLSGLFGIWLLQKQMKQGYQLLV